MNAVQFGISRHIKLTSNEIWEARLVFSVKQLFSGCHRWDMATQWNKSWIVFRNNYIVNGLTHLTDDMVPCQQWLRSLPPNQGKQFLSVHFMMTRKPVVNCLMIFILCNQVCQSKSKEKWSANFVKVKHKGQRNDVEQKVSNRQYINTVSYTHLTLPTILRV